MISMLMIDTRSNSGVSLSIERFLAQQDRIDRRRGREGGWETAEKNRGMIVNRGKVVDFTKIIRGPPGLYNFSSFIH